MTETPRDGTVQLPLNFAVWKTAFGIVWKLGIVLWFAFQFYSQQGVLLTTTKGMEARIVKLENTANDQDRKLVVAQGEIDYLKSIMKMQSDFEDKMRSWKR